MLSGWVVHFPLPACQPALLFDILLTRLVGTQNLTNDHDQYIIARISTVLDTARRTFKPIAGKAVVPLGVLPKEVEEGESKDKVLVFAKGEIAAKAKEAGADLVGDEETIAEVGWVWAKGTRKCNTLSFLMSLMFCLFLTDSRRKLEPDGLYQVPVHAGHVPIAHQNRQDPRSLGLDAQRQEGWEWNEPLMDCGTDRWLTVGVPF